MPRKKSFTNYEPSQSGDPLRDRMIDRWRSAGNTGDPSSLSNDQLTSETRQARKDLARQGAVESTESVKKNPSVASAAPSRIAGESTKGVKLKGPFDDIQRAMPEGYRVNSDPNAPDRMLVVAPGGKQTIGVNIRPHEEMGAFGKIWKMVSGGGKEEKVFSDQVTGTFNEATGENTYSGLTSAQMTAGYLVSAQKEAEKSGTDWSTEFHNLTSKGDASYGLSPLRSLPSSGGLAGQRKTARSIDFRTANTSGRATPQQAKELQEEFKQLTLLATRGETTPPISMSGGIDTGARPFSFKRLAAGQFALGKSGYVEPTLNRERIPEEPSPFWVGNRAEEKMIKAPNNAYALDQATPYVFDENNKPTAMQAKPITNSGPIPDYVQSNIRGMGNFRVGNVVRSLNPIAGGGFEYQASNEPKAAFWGTEATVPIPIKGVKIEDLLSGKSSLSLDQKMLSKTLGGGVDVAYIGTLQQEGKEPEDIKGRFGAREFNHRESEMYIPNFINRITGAPSEISEEMIDEMTPEEMAKNDIVSTESKVGPLSEKLGMRVVRRAGKDMGLTLYGAGETDTSTKGFGLKAGTSATGEAQSVEIGGQKYEANLWTGQVKGGENLMLQFGAMRPKEWMNILGDFAMRNKQGGRQMLQEFRNEYVKADKGTDRYAPAELGQAMDIDIDKMSARWSELSGKEDLGGVEFLKQVYQDTAMQDRNNPERQARNMKSYGQSEGMGGRELSASVWSKSSLASLKEDFATAVRVKTPKMTDEQVQGQWGKFFREEPGAEGFTKLHGITEKTASFGRQLIPTRTENTFKNTVNWDFMVAATNKYDEFTRQTGANIGQVVPQGDSARAAVGLWQYSAFQSSRRDAMSKGTEQAMPTNYTSVSPETLQGVSAFLKDSGTDMTSLEKVKAVSERFFADVPEDHLLYSPESKTFLANPKSVLGLSHEELGVVSSATAKAYLPGLQQLGEIVNPENGLKPHEMEDAGEGATSGFFSHVAKMVGGQGEFIKHALERSIPTAFGGGTNFDPTLETHEMNLSERGFQRIARQMGKKGRSVLGAARSMAESGAQFLFTRYPMLNQLKGVSSGALQKRSTRETAVGKEALKNIESNPRLRNRIGISLGMGKLSVGDFDVDPFQAIASFFKDPMGSIKAFFDPSTKAQQITNESINAELQQSLPNEKLRNKLSATVGEMGDYAENGGEGKDLMGKVLSGVGKKDPEAVLNAGLVAARTGVATGEAYFTDTSSSASYNATLDNLTGGKTTPVAKMMSESYIATGDDGPYMRMVALGEKDSYGTHNKKTGKANTNKTSVGAPLPLGENDPYALGKNFGTLLRGSAALAEQFARGVDIKGMGNQQIYSPRMVAEQFAIEGEGEKELLEERLTGLKPHQWPQAVVGYHQNVLKEHGAEKAQDKIFNSPAWFDLITNVKRKGIGRTDPVTGEQMIEGEESGMELLESRMMPETRERLQGAVAQEALERKNRDKGPRAFNANFLASAARTMKGVLQTGMQTITRQLNINTQDQDEFDRMFPDIKEAAPSDEGWFTQKRYDAAVKEGYTGSLNQYKSERKASQKLADVPIQAETAATQAAQVSYAEQKKSGFKGLAAKKLEQAYKKDNYVVLDTETTGKDTEDEVVQMSITDPSGKQLFNKKILPTATPISKEAQAVHGISMEDLRGAPSWGDVSEEVQGILKGKDILAYNASFDLKMMQQSEKASGGETDFEKTGNWVDILEATRQIQPGEAGYKQTQVAERMGITTEGAHDASADTAMALGIVKGHAKREGWDKKAESETEKYTRLVQKQSLTPEEQTEKQSLDAKYTSETTGGAGTPPPPASSVSQGMAEPEKPKKPKETKTKGVSTAKPVEQVAHEEGVGRPPDSGKKTPPPSGGDDRLIQFSMDGTPLNYYSGEDIRRVVGGGSGRSSGEERAIAREEAAKSTGGTVPAGAPRKFGGTREQKDQARAEGGGNYSWRFSREINDQRLPALESYMETKKDKPFFQEAHDVLEKLGYSGERTPGGVYDRLQQARVEKPGELFSAFTPEQLDRAARIPRLQEMVEQTQAQYQNTPGVDHGRVEDVIGAAGNKKNVLNQDVSTVGAIFKDAGSFKSREVQRAMKLSKTTAFKGAQSRLSQYEMQGLDSNDAIKKILVEGKVSEEEVARELGIDDYSTATPEQKEQVKKARESEPTFKQVFKRAEQLAPVKGVTTFADGVADVGKKAKGFSAEEGSAALGKADYISIAKEKIDSLTVSSERYAKALDGLNKAQSDGTTTTQESAKATREFAEASAKYKANVASIASEAAHKNVARVQGLISASGGTLATTLAPELSKSLREVEKAEKTEAEAKEGVKSLSPKSMQDRLGGAARHMLGGFGLMYLKSVVNFSTSGLGYGEEERNKLEQTMAQGAYQSTGATNVPYNQKQQLANNMALMGTNNNPLTGIQMAMSKSPVARDIYNMGSSALGTWGYTQFAASQLGGEATAAGRGLAKAAIPLAIGMGLVSTAADVGSRMQDPRGLGFRYGQTAGPGGGVPGFNDSLAVFATRVWGNQEQVNKLEKSVGQTKIIKAMFDEGATSNDKGRFGWDSKNAFTSNVGRALFTDSPFIKGSDISKADMYTGITQELISRNPNMSPESAAQTAGFIQRTPGIKYDDKRIEKIQADYQMGGWGAQTSMGMLQAVGMNAAQMYATPKGQDFSNVSQLQLKLTGTEYGEEQKARLSAGMQFAAQLPGVSRMPEIGAHGGAPVNMDKLEKFLDTLGTLSQTPAGNVYQAELRAWESGQAVGNRTAKPDENKYTKVTGTRTEIAPRPEGFIGPMSTVEIQDRAAVEMTPAEERKQTQAFDAQTQMNQYRSGMMQRYQVMAAKYGQPDVGGQISDFIEKVPQAQLGKIEGLMSLDPMRLQALASSNPEVYNKLGGLTTMQGNQMSVNTMASADIGMDGQLTGLGQYRTSLQQGSSTSTQTGQRIFGSMNNAGTQAAIQGVKLSGEGITLSNGKKVTEVGGTMGIQLAQRQEDYAYTTAQMGFQRQGMQQDYAYQMKMWGLQDQQRDLGWKHQQTQWGFQEEGMSLQLRGSEMNNNQFYQNMGMQQQQTQVQRGWQQQDWGINAQTRAMQWDWKQSDFQEEKRFMTGRQRRVAERGQEREGVMHNLEDEQIGRQKERTKELWQMEDNRFEVQKQQHAEQYALTMAQFVLQKKEFEEQKRYAIEGKKLEDEIIKLQRAHYLQQHKMSEEQLNLTEAHTMKVLELQQASDLMNTALEMEGGLRATLSENLLKFLQALTESGIIEALGETGNGGTTNTTSSGSSNYVSPWATQYTNPYAETDDVVTHTAPAETETQVGNKRAFGGPIVAGQEYLVGEMGPEKFRPSVNGTIVPNYTPSTGFSDLTPNVLPTRTQAARNNKPATIIVQIGNEELKRFVVDVVGEEF